jgi:hypothetical protein
MGSVRIRIVACDAWPPLELSASMDIERESLPDRAAASQRVAVHTGGDGSIAATTAV